MSCPSCRGFLDDFWDCCGDLYLLSTNVGSGYCAAPYAVNV